jgi:hypothetical protein
VEAKAEALEPPDFLDEKERDIFHKLKEALEPTALEVRTGYIVSILTGLLTFGRFKTSAVDVGACTRLLSLQRNSGVYQ